MLFDGRIEARTCDSVDESSALFVAYDGVDEASVTAVDGEVVVTYDHLPDLHPHFIG